MILDSGICTVFARTDVSGKGEMPRFEYTKKSQSYYGELDFSTDGTWTTQGRQDVVIDARIRILQDRTITQHDAVVLADVQDTKGVELYEIDRAYHGMDEESGMLISDLNLRRVNGR
ncbi:MAG: hypothetical protein IJ381_02900 [Clostridia bacterium]|nr:hypothetical protein [Clostridia bacterium]